MKLILFPILLLISASGAWANGASCVASLTYEERYMQAAEQLQVILNGNHPEKVLLMTELMDRTFLGTTNELSEILRGGKNMTDVDVKVSIPHRLAEDALKNLQKNLNKAAKISKETTRAMMAYLNSLRGTPEQRMKVVEADIQNRHYDLLEARRMLLAESEKLGRLIKDVDSRMPGLLDDSALVQDMIKIASDQDLQISLYRTQEQISLMLSMSKGAKLGAEQRLAANQMVLETIQMHVNGSLPLAASTSHIPVDFTARSKVQQLMLGMQELRTSDERLQLVLKTNLPPISQIEFLQVLGMLQFHHQKQAVDFLSKKIKDRIDAYSIGEILSASKHVDFQYLAELLSKTGFGLPLADFFRLKGQFSLGENDYLAAIPEVRKDAKAEVQDLLMSLRELNLVEGMVFLNLLSRGEPTYEHVVETAQTILAKLRTQGEQDNFKNRFERLLADKGLAFDHELAKLVHSYYGQDLLTQIESLLGVYHGKLKASQAIAVLRAIPRDSILPTGPSPEKHFDALKVALREYVTRIRLPNTKDAFTSADLLLMDMNLNTMIMFKSLQAMSGRANALETTTLSDLAFGIVNNSGVHDVPGNINPLKPKLQRPLDRGTSVKYIHDYFRELIGSKGN